jgi:hypothetical protein
MLASRAGGPTTCILDRREVSTAKSCLRACRNRKIDDLGLVFMLGVNKKVEEVSD